MTNLSFFDPCGNRVDEIRQFIYNSTEVWAEWGFPSEGLLFLTAWNSVRPWQIHQPGLPSFCYCTLYNDKNNKIGNRLHFAYEFGMMLVGFAQNVGFESLEDKRQSNPDALYFICEAETGYIKIGRSQDPSARLKSLQVANAKPLNLVKVLPGKGYLEKDFHQKFSDAKIGGEWFRPTAELLKYIVDILSAL